MWYRILRASLASSRRIVGYPKCGCSRGNIRGDDALLARSPRVLAWESHMTGFGHGERSEMGAESALAIAREQRSIAEVLVLGEAVPGLATGMPVAVTPEDHGAVSVAGELVRLTHEDIAVRRTDPRAGEVVVHFPRVGYRVEKV